ncbi:CAMP factor family pore-forming toxin [Streptococcus catagoni]|uniref:CAMP factor family pore-forming toxin n=1 Tax=Streptococcus catagoni TaxID=2654874 RepID=UPI00140C3976|nr:CAMP factor family pore-forming toxin [Streptococcus catagoni]
MKIKHMIFLSSTVAGLALFSPAVLNVQADQVANPVTVKTQASSQSNQGQELKEVLSEETAQLDALKGQVKGTTAERSVNNAIHAVENMKTSLRANPETIYDLGSIGTRIEAISDVIEAIVFSTNHLSNKVQQAHIDMGFGITKLVIRIADPFASVDSIKAQVEAVKKLETTVLSYPDLKPTDTATIYTKSKLDKAIWHTRFERDRKVLNVKSFQVYNTLNKAITHAVGVQLNPSVTVQGVDQEIANLQAALVKALQ